MALRLSERGLQSAEPLRALRRRRELQLQHGQQLGRHRVAQREGALLPLRTGSGAGNGLGGAGPAAGRHLCGVSCAETFNTM